jgi:hypothetical protein
MNQEHEGVWNKTRRKASLFPAGKLLNTAPPAFFSAVIGQARMIAADAVEDFFPFLDLPFDQQVYGTIFFGAFQGSDRPL